MDSPWRRELALAVLAVRVGARIAEALSAEKDRGGTVEKSDLTPVTVADFAIQALLAATVEHCFPHDVVVGEESADDLRADPALLESVWAAIAHAVDEQERDEPGGLVVQGAGLEGLRVVPPRSREHLLELVDACGAAGPSPSTPRTWIVDPIDGTASFVKNELYAINVALVEAGAFETVSCIGAPNMTWRPLPPATPLLNADVEGLSSGTRGCVMLAARGYGAWRQPLFVAPSEQGDVAPVRLERLDETVKTTADLRFVGCTTVDSGATDVHDAVATLARDPASSKSDVLSWVLRWVAMARGAANAVVWVYKKRSRLAKTWDHAGAMLLFREVGGVVSDIDGHPIDLATGRTYDANYGFVAAPAHLHVALLARVREVLPKLRPDLAHVDPAAEVRTAESVLARAERVSAELVSAGNTCLTEAAKAGVAAAKERLAAATRACGHE
ncbi:hypothetical protein RB594_003530 [Gaeumannomyces avenae]